MDKKSKSSFLINNNDPNIINEYFRWLCSIVDHCKTHSMLLQELHAREFYYTIDRDENRAKDGKFLRYIFGMEINLEDADLVLSGPCSILEMLIALAGRMDGAASIGLDVNKDASTKKNFWTMMENLDLKGETDDYYDPSEVNHILDRWMFREYDANGDGGLFPLKNPKCDQREVEIWMQLQAYLLENDSINFD